MFIQVDECEGSYALPTSPHSQFFSLCWLSAITNHFAGQLFLSTNGVAQFQVSTPLISKFATEHDPEPV
jgi:hypothetical protein